MEEPTGQIPSDEEEEKKVRRSERTYSLDGAGEDGGEMDGDPDEAAELAEMAQAQREIEEGFIDDRIHYEKEEGSDEEVPYTRPPRKTSASTGRLTKKARASGSEEDENGSEGDTDSDFDYEDEEEGEEEEEEQEEKKKKVPSRLKDTGEEEKSKGRGMKLTENGMGASALPAKKSSSLAKPTFASSSSSSFSPVGRGRGRGSAAAAASIPSSLAGSTHTRTLSSLLSSSPAPASGDRRTSAPIPSGGRHTETKSLLSGAGRGSWLPSRASELKRPVPHGSTSSPKTESKLPVAGGGRSVPTVYRVALLCPVHAHNETRFTPEIAEAGLKTWRTRLQEIEESLGGSGKSRMIVALTGAPWIEHRILQSTVDHRDRVEIELHMATASDDSEWQRRHHEFSKSFYEDSTLSLKDLTTIRSAVATKCVDYESMSALYSALLPQCQEVLVWAWDNRLPRELHALWSTLTSRKRVHILRDSASV